MNVHGIKRVGPAIGFQDRLRALGSVASRECLLWGPGAVTRPISASQAIPIDRTRNSLGAFRDNSANAIASRTTRTKSPRRPDLNHTLIRIPEEDLRQMWRIARSASNSVIAK